MGVDANVIIAERISEEIKGGKTTKQAITIGFKNAFSSVFDGNVTVMIVAVILMLLGSGSMTTVSLGCVWMIRIPFTTQQNPAAFIRIQPTPIARFDKMNN